VAYGPPATARVPGESTDHATREPRRFIQILFAKRAEIFLGVCIFGFSTFRFLYFVEVLSFGFLPFF
jgi:hypothetical protein